MTTNADNIPGQAPSLLPTGTQGGSSETVSILRDLDPRLVKFGASPSLPYRTILLVAVSLAIGVALLSGYLYSAAREEGPGASAASAADTPFVAAAREVSVPVSPTVAVSSEIASNAPQESQRPAIILAHPDTGESGTERPKANPLSIQAEGNAGQPPASSSGTQGRATSESTTSNQTKQKAASKAAPVIHAKKSVISQVKSAGGEKKAIEHEVDIITAIVKGSQH